MKLSSEQIVTAISDMTSKFVWLTLACRHVVTRPRLYAPKIGDLTLCGWCADEKRQRETARMWAGAR